MLLWLTRYLTEFYSGFNVFEYITFRTIVSAITALVIALLVGPVVIRRFAQSKIGETIREDGPSSHASKRGTPTMGGVLIVVAIVVSTLLWGDLTSKHVWIVVGVIVGFGAIGFADDYKKLRQGKGISIAWKYFFQSAVGLTAAIVMFTTATSPEETELIIPIFKQVAIPLGFGFIVLSYLMIVGMSNAVNFTDGLDGLAIMPTVMVGAALGLIAYLVGHSEFSDYLQIPHIPRVGEISIICGCIVGAGLGFLWYNTYPAQVFMGDVGALALGAALGTIGVIVRHEIVLLIMGGIFVVETASVIVQVLSYKITGRRIFQMAPIHHHFELKDWPEPRIVVRFWIIAFMLVLIGLSMLKLR